MSETLPEKPCAKCSAVKPLEDFHRQPTGPMGRHSWCKDCNNRYWRDKGRPRATTEQRRHWSRRTRYKMGTPDYEAMLLAQGGTCAICETEMKHPRIDHCHVTGKVRGILCQACNLKLAGIDDTAFLEKALTYLGFPTSFLADRLVKTGPSPAPGRALKERAPA